MTCCSLAEPSAFSHWVRVANLPSVGITVTGPCHCALLYVSIQFLDLDISENYVEFCSKMEFYYIDDTVAPPAWPFKPSA